MPLPGTPRRAPLPTPPTPGGGGGGGGGGGEDLYEAMEHAAEEEEEIYAAADDGVPAAIPPAGEVDLNNLIDRLAFEEEDDPPPLPRLPPPRGRVVAAASANEPPLEYDVMEREPADFAATVMAVGEDDMYNMHLPFAPQVQQQQQMLAHEAAQLRAGAGGLGAPPVRPGMAAPPDSLQYEEADRHNGGMLMQEDIYDEMGSSMPVAAGSDDMYSSLPPGAPLTARPTARRPAATPPEGEDVAPALPSKGQRAGAPAVVLAANEVLYGVPSGLGRELQQPLGMGEDLYSVLPPTAAVAADTGQEEYSVLPQAPTSASEVQRAPAIGSSSSAEADM